MAKKYEVDVDGRKAQVTVPGAEQAAPANETKVLARSYKSHWYKAERGAYQTVRSFWYEDTPAQEEKTLLDFGAFADGFADIRLAITRSTRRDGTRICLVCVLAAPSQVARVRDLVDAYMLGMGVGKHSK